MKLHEIASLIKLHPIKHNFQRCNIEHEVQFDVASQTSMFTRIFFFFWHVKNLYANIRSIFSTRLQKFSIEEKTTNLLDVSH